MSLCFLGTTPCLLSLAVTESGPIPRLSVLDLAPGSPFLSSFPIRSTRTAQGVITWRQAPSSHFSGGRCPNFFRGPSCPARLVLPFALRAKLYTSFFCCFQAALFTTHCACNSFLLPAAAPFWAATGRATQRMKKRKESPNSKRLTSASRSHTVVCVVREF